MFSTISSKVFLGIIAGLILLGTLGFGLSYYLVSSKNKEINKLNIELTIKDTQIIRLETNSLIDKSLNELGIRLTSNVLLDLQKINTKYSTIKRDLTTIISQTDKENKQAVSQAIYDSLQLGYEATK